MTMMMTDVVATVRGNGTLVAMEIYNSRHVYSKQGAKGSEGNQRRIGDEWESERMHGIYILCPPVQAKMS